MTRADAAPARWTVTPSVGASTLSVVLRRVVAARYVLPLREGGSLPAVVEAEDGRAYVVKTGSEATEVTVIDPETFTVVKQIAQDPEQGRAPHALAFDPANQRLFVANKDSGTLSAIDVV